MHLFFLLFSIVFSRVLSLSVADRGDLSLPEKSPSQRNQEDSVNRQNLLHDLNWDENTDGSYDLLTEGPPIQLREKPTEHGLIDTQFSQLAVDENNTEFPEELLKTTENFEEASTEISEVPEENSELENNPEISVEAEIVLGSDVDNLEGSTQMPRVQTDLISKETDNIQDDVVGESHFPTEVELETRSSKTAFPSGLLKPEKQIHEMAFNTDLTNGELEDTNRIEIVETDPERTSWIIFFVSLLCLSTVVFFGLISLVILRRRLWIKQQNALGNAYHSSDPLRLISDQQLGKSAETYHFHQQKRQLVLTSSSSSNSSCPENNFTSSRFYQKRRSNYSDYETEHDAEEIDGDYTVYECPGLAPAGELEVFNPLFVERKGSIIIVSED